MERDNFARNAWIALAAGITAIDYYAPPNQTLSEGCDRALERHPILTTLAVGTVALHLLNVLPPQIDPIHQLANHFRKGDSM